MITEQYDIKLIDFGLSEYYIPNMDVPRVGGTFNYMSIETLIDFPSLSPSADVWSIGCIAYNILCSLEFDPVSLDRETQLKKIFHVFGTPDANLNHALYMKCLPYFPQQ